METHTNERSEDQQSGFLREQGNREGDRDVRAILMGRAKREEALAWAQAYRLIRGGADEVSDVIENAQYTIEVLLHTLRELTCGACGTVPGSDHQGCDACRRREALLAILG